MQKTIQVLAPSKLDRTASMQSYLKEHLKTLTELNKGVQSMKVFLYPTILQKTAMTSVKTAKNSNVVIRYTEFNGIKLTVMLPLLHNQIKNAIANMAQEEPQMTYSAVVSHSQSRSMILADFVKELTHFC